MLIFYRGISTDKTHGLLLWEKLDVLFARLLALLSAPILLVIALLTTRKKYPKVCILSGIAKYLSYF